MKKNKIGISVVCLLVFSLFAVGNASASDNPTFCKDRQFINAIAVGDIPQLHLGGDVGNDVFVQFVDDSKWYPLNKNRNLNNSMGPSILATLNNAMVMRLPVTIADHYGIRCDDFDEVIVWRD